MARNFAWNLAGSGWGVLLALVATPLVVHGLGASLYGIYALLGVLLSYFKFGELGMSRAVERHVAAALGAEEEDRIPAYVESALWLQLGVSVVLGAGVGLGGPWLLGLFEIPPEHLGEARAAVRWMAAGMAASFLGGIPNALLRAHQRFSTLNRISIVTQTLLSGLAVTVALLHPTLLALVIASVGTSLLRLVIASTIAFRMLPRVPRPKLHRESLRELFSFGGSLTLANLLNPLLAHSEKLLVGALVSTTALTYYIVPYRVLSRFSLVSGSLSNALFPFLSDLDGKGDQAAIRRSMGRANSLIAWLLLPPFALLLIAGHRLLALWMGEDFARQATGVLPFLVVGTFINLLARNSVAAIQARGRPGLLAWLYLGELVFYLPLAWVLMERFGVVGAAAAWCTRVAVDTVLLRWIAGHLTRSPGRTAKPRRMLWPTAAAAALVMTGGALAAGPVHGLGVLVVGGCVALALALLAWAVALTSRERQVLLRVATSFLHWRAA